MLSNGTVLVAGGLGTSGGYLTSAEIYNAATDTWSFTGSLATARSGHTATLLPNGQVLVAAGDDSSSSNPTLSSCELFNPATGSWSAAAPLANPRDGHTATLLSNGMVLVAGGIGTLGGRDAELYNPATNTWTTTGLLATPHWSHTATLLSNGMVLVAGGSPTVTTAELYNPATGAWSAAGSLTTARWDHIAALLPNGNVVIAGGFIQTSPNTSAFIRSAELYNPATNTWTVIQPMETTRAFHTANLLSSGQLLVAAGEGVAPDSAPSAELFNPANNTWSETGMLTTGRWNHTATLLQNGEVLVAGGNVFLGPIASAEIYGSCSVAAPSNGTRGTCPSVLPSGSSCQLACNSGYSLTGAATSCSVGVLNAQTCGAESCAITAPSNGTLGTCPSVLPSGSSCQLACNSGYSLTGAATSCSFGTLNAQTCSVTNTPVGSNVVVPTLPPNLVTFSQVTQAGNTTVTVDPTCSNAPPQLLVAGSSFDCLDVSTTATYSGATVCIPVPQPPPSPLIVNKCDPLSQGASCLFPSVEYSVAGSALCCTPYSFANNAVNPACVTTTTLSLFVLGKQASLVAAPALPLPGTIALALGLGVTGWSVRRRQGRNAGRA
jgi:N-acetylneuraminic acid mutarotase